MNGAMGMRGNLDEIRSKRHSLDLVERDGVVSPVVELV
jgi:hypothetical protein